MDCQACGVGAETREVTFHQNVGVLIVRFTNTVSGHLCKSCIHRYFWSMTTVSLFFGWWGVISLLINPFILLLNVIRYLGCLGMRSPSPGASWGGAAADVENAPAPMPRAATAGECYLCGRPLRPEERQSRVCQACS